MRTGSRFRKAGSLASNIWRFKVGSIDCFILSDGVFPQGSLDLLFGGVNNALVKERARVYGLPTQEIEIPLNLLLVRAESGDLLLDAGYGTLATRSGFPAGRLIANLRGAGVELDSIRSVLITHSHPDHLGGVADDQGILTFPKARYLMWKDEWNYAYDQGDWMRQRLDAIGDRLHLFDGEVELAPGVAAIPMPGHTPGHGFVRIASQGQELLCTTDMLGHEIHVEFPKWSMSHEVDREKAAAIRLRVLKAAAESRTLLHSCHIAFPGLGYVVETESRLEWKPVLLE